MCLKKRNGVGGFPVFIQECGLSVCEQDFLDFPFRFRNALTENPALALNHTLHVLGYHVLQLYKKKCPKSKSRGDEKSKSRCFTSARGTAEVGVQQI